MVSNDASGIFVGWGMSIASKRAKERQNRSSDELVTDKTKISRSQYLQVTDVRRRTDVRSSDVRSGSEIRCFSSGVGFRSSGKGRTSGGLGSTRDLSSGTRFWAEFWDLGSKLRRFRGWKVGKLGEMLDPLETKQIHGSNPTKHHQTNKS